ncbi:YidC/Oxa1 family membrane protein insertase [Iamia sp.]|uniref:YidC/Oxa1 family membrane protein insertase n=1 Tax=Iamia sp. TaxID=2722710 RepID=UPI002C90BB66|nr:YidC/Oxa1 family membrane protein insertase [Iamia sp.]HXH57795.1 YidC/Oxa1 family membrane protein insertase [Iamia sp.]
MDFLFDAIATVLAYLYDLTSSFGGAIMLLTLAVMVVVTPLTLKSTRSMIAMQQLQPELRKLQAKHKDDRQKLNEEMMAFYKEHNINPLGGCLPLVVQMPVFIVLYRVLIGLVKLPGYGSDMGRAAGLFARNPDGGGTYSGFGTFDPGYLDHETGLYQALDDVREMQSFGLDLADTFTNKFSEGLVDALPYLVLVLLIGITAWYQQRQIQARNAGNQPQINSQQQMLMKVMPFFLPIFSLTLPAGIVLYFLVSNLYRIGQQAFITHTMYSEKAQADREAKVGAKGRDGAIDTTADKVSRKDTVPTGSRSLLGGLIQLPSKAGTETPRSNGAAKGSAPATSGSKPSSKPSSPSRSGSTTKTGTKAPARKAPARPAAPANQNRSKKKKKRT